MQLKNKVDQLETEAKANVDKMNKLKQLALKSKKESVDLKNKVISSVRLKYMVQRKDGVKIKWKKWTCSNTVVNPRCRLKKSH